MNPLITAIQNAFEFPEDTKKINKVYLEFIKANFIIPIENSSNEEEPKVLFFQEHDQVFLPIFTEMDFLDAWAGEIANEIKILRLTGVNLLKGLGDEVIVCLDIGSPSYKEFYPEETARMKSLVLKLFKQ